MVITGFQAWRAGTRSWNAWVRTEFSCGTVEIGRDITTIDRYTLYIPCIPTKIHERSCNWGDFPIFLTLFYGPNFWIPEEMATNQVVGEGLCFHPSLSGGSVVQEYAANMSRKKVKEDKMKAPTCAGCCEFWHWSAARNAGSSMKRSRQRKERWCMEGLEVLIHGDVKLQTIDFGQGENEKMEQTIQQTAAALDGLNQFVLIAGKHLGRTDLFLKHFGSQNLSLKGIAQISLGMPIDQPFQMSLTPQELTNGYQDRQLVRMRMDYMDGLSSGQTMDDWDKKAQFLPSDRTSVEVDMFWSVEPFPALDIASILSIYQRWPGCKDVFDGLQGWGWMPILCHLSCLWMVLKPAKWTNLGFGFSELGCCSVLCSLLTQRFAVSLAKFESGWSDEEPAERMHLREDQDAERTWGRSGQQTGDVDSVTGWNSRMTVTMTELMTEFGTGQSMSILGFCVSK